VRDKAGYCTLM